MASLAELLRELKERSGLSYGVLARRLHMSTSTLHRYCNGDAVPTEFAPVERLARLCKATPEELVEVHRRWILADAARGKKAEQPQPPQPPPSAPTPTPESVPESDQVVVVSKRPPTRRRRTVVLAAAVAAVVGLGSIALAMSGDGDGDGHKRQAGTATSPGPGVPTDTSPGKAENGENAENAENKDGEKGKADSKNGKKGEPSEAPAKKGAPAPDAPRRDGKGPTSGGAQDDPGVPLTVRTRPYAYDDPCLQSFLVNRKAAEVPQQPAAQDAPSWVGDLGAVPAGYQFIEVTVQGMSKDTVVLQDMNVRVQSTSAPLAWNNFQMATGCGGTVNTKSFSVDLDAAAPDAKPVAGQRDFPYKVSESDPEVFYIMANTDLHDVRWYLELEWSSGRRHDALRVDDQGKPFRTSGSKGRPTYGWPPGASKWQRQLQDG
ncbi:helix-turn-helix domain-containing protein [Streptomyces sp. NPDC029674]|uniref:helix-turn-helix domain-containing protein n=1 Tax=Streptomyces sp. NPDC029674 TaxID=3365297 RepID=UPI0038506D20